MIAGPAVRVSGQNAFEGAGASYWMVDADVGAPYRHLGAQHRSQGGHDGAQGRSRRAHHGALGEQLVSLKDPPGPARPRRPSA